MKYSLAIAILLLGTHISPGGENHHISERLAVRAIVGEAAGEPFRGKLAVACAIRNRGTLKGVYGVHAKHVWHEPRRVWRQAEKAWAMSRTNDITHGASFWEGTEFKKPYWAKHMKATLRVGHQVFYKPTTKK